MKLYEQVDLARKFGDGNKVGITESVESKEPDKTSVALGVAKRLAEAQHEESKPVQLAAYPISN